MSRNKKQRGISKYTALLQYAVFPLIIIVLWQTLYQLEWINPISLSSPAKVMNRTTRLLLEGVLQRNILSSLERVLIGYAVAALLAVLLGIAAGWSRVSERLFDVIIQILKPIPPIAWIPLAILWFGIGEQSKVFIISIGAFFPIFVNVVDGIRQIEGRYIEVAEILQVPWHRFALSVLIPGALPSIMTGLRVGLGVAWVCVVAAELIAAENGIGYMIMDARYLAQSDTMIVGMLTIGVIGKIMDSLLRRVERLFLVWK